MDPYSLDHIIYYSFPIYVKELKALLNSKTKNYLRRGFYGPDKT
jgi:hypothetical protein